MNIHSPVSGRSQTNALTVALGILSALAIAALPSLMFGTVFWSVGPERLPAILALCASYLVCIAMLAAWRASGKTVGPVTVISALAIAYAPTLLFLLLSKSAFSRKLLIVELVLSAALLGVAVVLQRFRALRTAALALAVLCAIALQSAYLVHILPRPPQPSVAVMPVYSALYDLKITEYRQWFLKPEVKGGGITHVGDRYLLTTGDGDLYLVSEISPDKKLGVQRLPYKVPLNMDDFLAAAEGKVDTTWFRTADVITQEAGGKVRLFATHHVWKTKEQCFVVRVSELDGSEEDFLNARPGMSWKTLYETHPCEPINFSGHPPFFGGLQIGGRLTFIDESHLLVSLGDNGLDGWNVPTTTPQDMTVSYGKTMLVSIVDGSSEIFSIGHRNPQGLYADGAGNVWLTEHGPQGGDELNRIERGFNYGYPIVTMGVEYGTHSWPFDPVPGGHDGYVYPYYAWIPSIGVSNLVVSNSAQFNWWKGDLLVSSLKDRAIYRLRVRDNRVVMTERISIGVRVRDIEQGHSGELALWTDDASFMFIRANTDVSSGEAMFDRCVGCHAIENGASHGFGPDLYKVVDRSVASAAGFQYSPALKGLGGDWTRERLDAFLANPQRFAPGTSMQFTGIPEATGRERLIEFLASGKKRTLGQTVVP